MPRTSPLAPARLAGGFFVANAPRPILGRFSPIRNRTDMYDRHDLKWDSDQLRLVTGHRLATVERDSKWPSMWRVRLPDGYLTEMVNKTRAKDAAIVLALGRLNELRPGAA